MTDGLAMDLATMEAEAAEVRRAPPEDPWLARRRLTFGASEVPVLLIALGLEAPSPLTPKYIVSASRKLFGMKAGTRKPDAGGRAAQVGNDVERELLEVWSRDPLSGWAAATHADAVPREWLPLVDRHCPRLSCTPDAWCRQSGELVNVQIKTDVGGGKRTITPWWRSQVQAEMAVTGSARSLLLYGGGWACDWMDRRERPVAWVVERDEVEIERIRSAVIVGWNRVEQIMAGKPAKESK